MFMNAQLIQLTLNELNASSEDILASALISNDGLPVVTALSDDVDGDRVGGMTAALLSLGTRVTKELRCGNMNQVIVRGDEGYLLMLEANEEMVLVVTAKEDAKLGLILFQARSAIKSLWNWQTMI